MINQNKFLRNGGSRKGISKSVHYLKEQNKELEIFNSDS